VHVDATEMSSFVLAMGGRYCRAVYVVAAAVAPVTAMSCSVAPMVGII